MLLLQTKTMRRRGICSLDLSSHGLREWRLSSKLQSLWMLKDDTTGLLYCFSLNKRQNTVVKWHFRLIVPSALRPTNFGRLRDLNQSLTLPPPPKAVEKSSVGENLFSETYPRGLPNSQHVRAIVAGPQRRCET